MQQEIENKIAYCQRQLLRCRPEQKEKIQETLDNLIKWRDNVTVKQTGS